MSQLQQLIGYGMSLGIDVSHQVILSLGANNHLRVVVKEIHLHINGNKFTSMYHRISFILKKFLDLMFYSS